ELALDMGHEAKAIEGCADDEYESWIDMHIRRERQWVDIARQLRADEPSEFTAVMFDGTDKIQHLCWRFLDPAMTREPADGWEQKIRDKCREYYRELDQRIGELCALIPDATVFVTSDHGFGAQVRTFFVNSWLENAGLLAWRDGQAPETSGASSLGLNQLTRHVYQLDWNRTRAYAPLPSGNGIHIVQADDAHPDGVPPAEYHAFRERLADQLRLVTDPVTGEHIINRVWTRDELFQGRNLALAPDLTLELSDGGLISILASPESIRQRPVPTGTHRPDGVFVAAGAECRRGVRVDALSILDVAPLMLHTLGLPIPMALEGRVALEVFESAALAVRPPQRDVEVASAVGTTEVVLDPEAEAEILERLQALGYVE
ncbi:MAG TPA: alkaline phosphatase family protein, partial [Planctomycetaceae bacterium]|nr:alkaline phosphatase family protein [Planctomycetaceae bacterium]